MKALSGLKAFRVWGSLQECRVVGFGLRLVHRSTESFSADQHTYLL